MERQESHPPPVHVLVDIASNIALGMVAAEIEFIEDRYQLDQIFHILLPPPRFASWLKSAVVIAHCRLFLELIDDQISSALCREDLRSRWAFSTAVKPAASGISTRAPESLRNGPSPIRGTNRQHVELALVFILPPHHSSRDLLDLRREE